MCYSYKSRSCSYYGFQVQLQCKHVLSYSHFHAMQNYSFLFHHSTQAIIVYPLLQLLKKEVFSSRFILIISFVASMGQVCNFVAQKLIESFNFLLMKRCKNNFLNFLSKKCANFLIFSLLKLWRCKTHFVLTKRCARLWTWRQRIRRCVLFFRFFFGLGAGNWHNSGLGSKFRFFGSGIFEYSSSRYHRSGMW